jgi:hypothetical protein
MENVQSVGSNSNMKTMQDFLIEEREISQIGNRAISFRQDNSRNWKKLINQRKWAYYYSIANREKAQIYEDFLANVPIFLPRKFREDVLSRLPIQIPHVTERRR